MPPQHGKSTLVAEYFPQYQFAYDPGARMIFCSYEANFAAYWSNKSRQVMKEHGLTFMPGMPLEIDPGLNTRDWWGIKGTGGYVASAGVGGPVTGKGASVFVIDDPHKNAQEALSATYQQAAVDWYKSVAQTRLTPDGAVILIQTRWDENDLTGRLLKEGTEDWTVLSLPALAVDEDDPLGRAIGEPLWPERGWTRERYLQLKESMGSYWFNAMYQQKPVPIGGGVFKREYFRYARDGGVDIILERPAAEGGDKHVAKSQCRCFQTVDLASSIRDTADYFVIETWVATPWNELVLLDIVRTRVEGPDQLPLIWSTFRRWGAAVIGIEKVGYQQTMLQQAIRDGLPAIGLDADRDKYQRALSIAARYEARSVFHMHGIVNLDDFEQEMLRFNPLAPGHDDMVDCAAYAARFLYEGGGEVGSRPMVMSTARRV